MLLDGRWTGPILDKHIHLDRSNKFLDAVTEFVGAGGTGIMLESCWSTNRASPQTCPPI